MSNDDFAPTMDNPERVCRQRGRLSPRNTGSSRSGRRTSRQGGHRGGQGRMGKWDCPAGQVGDGQHRSHSPPRQVVLVDGDVASDDLARRSLLRGDLWVFMRDSGLMVDAGEWAHRERYCYGPSKRGWPPR